MHGLLKYLFPSTIEDFSFKKSIPLLLILGRAPQGMKVALEIYRDSIKLEPLPNRFMHFLKNPIDLLS